jgi:hypothetical protein
LITRDSRPRRHIDKRADIILEEFSKVEEMENRKGGGYNLINITRRSYGYMNLFEGTELLVVNGGSYW